MAAPLGSFPTTMPGRRCPCLCRQAAQGECGRQEGRAESNFCTSCSNPTRDNNSDDNDRVERKRNCMNSAQRHNSPLTSTWVQPSEKQKDTSMTRTKTTDQSRRGRALLLTTARIRRLARLLRKLTGWLRGGPDLVGRPIIHPVLHPYAPPLSAAQKTRRARVTHLYRHRWDISTGLRLIDGCARALSDLDANNVVVHVAQTVHGHWRRRSCRRQG